MSKSELRLDASEIECTPTLNAHTNVYSETLVIYVRAAQENSHSEMKTVITEITEAWPPLPVNSRCRKQHTHT